LCNVYFNFIPGVLIISKLFLRRSSMCSAANNRRC
jgi:hypothetical protein